MDEIGLARIHIAHLIAFGREVIEPRKHVIAMNYGDFEARRGLQDGARTSQGIDATRIRNHLDVSGFEFLRETSNERREIAGITKRRVVEFLLLQNRHRDLGQVIEHEEIDRAFIDKANRRLEPVAPEALSVGYANHFKASPE